MDPEIMLWDSAALEYDAHIKRGDTLREKLLNKTALVLLGDMPGKKILDAGCGQGYFVKILSEKRADALGFDASAKLIELAKKNYPEIQDRFLVLNLKKTLPWRDGEWDAAVSNMTLMDIDPIDGAVAEMRRILKGGGIFVFSILHPLFSSGDLQKSILEKILVRPPHYAAKSYKTPARREWRIRGLAKPTRVFHRPIEFYAETLARNGFRITDIREPVLDKEFAEDSGNNFYRFCSEFPTFFVVKAEAIG